MAAPPPPSGGNVLTQKLGPLPGWAWAAIAIGVVVVYRLRKNAAAAAASTTAATPATTPVDTSGTSGGVGYLPSSSSGVPYSYSGGAGAPFSYSGPTDLSSGALASLLGEQPAGATAVTPGAGVSNSVASPLTGLTYLPTYSAFEQAKKSGKTIDYVTAGSSTPTPFYVGGKQVGAAPPSGSRWYVVS